MVSRVIFGKCRIIDLEDPITNQDSTFFSVTDMSSCMCFFGVDGCFSDQINASRTACGSQQFYVMLHLRKQYAVFVV